MIKSKLCGLNVDTTGPPCTDESDHAKIGEVKFDKKIIAGAPAVVITKEVL